MSSNRKGPKNPTSSSNSESTQSERRGRKPFNVLSFVAGLVFMVAGLSFLGQQNDWFSIDLGVVLPVVAIVGGLATFFGTRNRD